MYVDLYRLWACFISWIKAFFLGLRAGCTGTQGARGNAHSLPTHFVAVSPQFILSSHLRLSECRKNHLAREGKSNPTWRLRCFLGAYQGSCPRLLSNFASWCATTHSWQVMKLSLGLGVSATSLNTLHFCSICLEMWKKIWNNICCLSNLNEVPGGGKNKWGEEIYCWFYPCFTFVTHLFGKIICCLGICLLLSSRTVVLMFWRTLSGDMSEERTGPLLPSNSGCIFFSLSMT